MPYPLESFYEQAKTMEPVKPKLVDTNFDQLNRNFFKQSIPKIPFMDEHNLAILIKNNIDTIAADILQNDQEYGQLFRDNKFISSFIRAINSIPIEYNTKLACNKITYDYFTSDNPDPGIKAQYLNMSRVVNREAINKLIAIGLDEVTACNLALCRYSSANERTNVARLNFAIYMRDPEVMTEQMIIWIYEKLFTRISDLFYATMFDCYSVRQQTDFGENFIEVYGTVGLAILVILNNMTSENIQRVLIGYAAEWEYAGYPAVRFSLHALSEDYSKIIRVVDYLTSSGKRIP